MTAMTDDIVRELRSLGFDAHPSHDPSEVWIAAKLGGGSVCLARDFNISGWEAAWDPAITEPDHDQRPLHAWLSGDADAFHVALWAAALAYDPRRVLDAESCKSPA